MGKFKDWVNAEVAKKLDREPFSSLPRRMRAGILLLAASFIIGHGSNLLALVLPGLNRQLSAGGFIKGSAIYLVCYVTGCVGLSLAGKDSIKYPKYFLAKFLKRIFPAFFREDRETEASG